MQAQLLRVIITTGKSVASISVLSVTNDSDNGTSLLCQYLLDSFDYLAR